MCIWLRHLSVTQMRTAHPGLFSRRWVISPTSIAPVPRAKVARGCGTTYIVTSSVRGRVFVDTNVIAYRFDGSEPDKQARAEMVLGQDEDFVVSTQVMLELHSVLTRRLAPRWSATDARAVLDDLAKLHVVTADARLVLRAAATSERHQLSVWDAMIVEAAVESGCSELWSEDLATDSHIRGVLVVNPFA